MPRHVDQTERRELVARAVWRVILRDGMSGATVRAVAQEAELSVGSLRYYFRSQHELQTYAFELLNVRAAERVAAVDQTAPLRQRIEEILWALLPVTPEQAEEERLRLAFLVAARTDPNLAGVASADYRQAMTLTREAVTALSSGSAVAVDHLTWELFGLLHGLAQAAALYPEQATGDMIRHAVRSWLDRNLTSDERTP